MKGRVCGLHGKQSYGSRQAAIRACLSYSKRRGTPLRIYFDHSCKTYHVTSKVKRGWHEDAA